MENKISNDVVDTIDNSKEYYAQDNFENSGSSSTFEDASDTSALMELAEIACQSSTADASVDFQQTLSSPASSVDLTDSSLRPSATNSSNNDKPILKTEDILQPVIPLSNEEKKISSIAPFGTPVPVVLLGKLEDISSNERTFSKEEKIDENGQDLDTTVCNENTLLNTEPFVVTSASSKNCAKSNRLCNRRKSIFDNSDSCDSDESIRLSEETNNSDNCIVTVNQKVTEVNLKVKQSSKDKNTLSKTDNSRMPERDDFQNISSNLECDFKQKEISDESKQGKHSDSEFSETKLERQELCFKKTVKALELVSNANDQVSLCAFPNNSCIIGRVNSEIQYLDAVVGLNKDLSGTTNIYDGSSATEVKSDSRSILDINPKKELNILSEIITENNVMEKHNNDFRSICQDAEKQIADDDNDSLRKLEDASNVCHAKYSNRLVSNKDLTVLRNSVSEIELNVCQILKGSPTIDIGLTGNDHNLQAETGFCKEASCKISSSNCDDTFEQQKDGSDKTYIQCRSSVIEDKDNNERTDILPIVSNITKLYLENTLNYIERFTDENDVMNNVDKINLQEENIRTLSFEVEPIPCSSTSNSKVYSNASESMQEVKSNSLCTITENTSAIKLGENSPADFNSDFIEVQEGGKEISNEPMLISDEPENYMLNMECIASAEHIQMETNFESQILNVSEDSSKAMSINTKNILNVPEQTPDASFSAVTNETPVNSTSGSNMDEGHVYSNVMNAFEETKNMGFKEVQDLHEQNIDVKVDNADTEVSSSQGMVVGSSQTENIVSDSHRILENLLNTVKFDSQNGLNVQKQNLDSKESESYSVVVSSKKKAVEGDNIHTYSDRGEEAIDLKKVHEIQDCSIDSMSKIRSTNVSSSSAIAVASCTTLGVNEDHDIYNNESYLCSQYKEMVCESESMKNMQDASINTDKQNGSLPVPMSEINDYEDNYAEKEIAGRSHNSHLTSGLYQPNDAKMDTIEPDPCRADSGQSIDGKVDSVKDMLAPIKRCIIKNSDLDKSELHFERKFQDKKCPAEITSNSLITRNLSEKIDEPVEFVYIANTRPNIKDKYDSEIIVGMENKQKNSTNQLINIHDSCKVSDIILDISKVSDKTESTGDDMNQNGKEENNCANVEENCFNAFVDSCRKDGVAFGEVPEVILDNKKNMSSNGEKNLHELEDKAPMDVDLNISSECNEILKEESSKMLNDNDELPNDSGKSINIKDNADSVPSPEVLSDQDFNTDSVPSSEVVSDQDFNTDSVPSSEVVSDQDLCAEAGTKGLSSIFAVSALSRTVQNDISQSKTFQESDLSESECSKCINSNNSIIHDDIGLSNENNDNSCHETNGKENESKLGLEPGVDKCTSSLENARASNFESSVFVDARNLLNSSEQIQDLNDAKENSFSAVQEAIAEKLKLNQQSLIVTESLISSEILNTSHHLKRRRSNSSDDSFHIVKKVKFAEPLHSLEAEETDEESDFDDPSRLVIIENENEISQKIKADTPQNNLTPVQTEETSNLRKDIIDSCGSSENKFSLDEEKITDPIPCCSKMQTDSSSDMEVVDDIDNETKSLEQVASKEICVKCKETWNSSILKLLFEGNESVTIRSKITYGAIICMNNYALLHYRHKEESAVRRLLFRAGLGLSKNLSSIKISTLNPQIIDRINKWRMTCCDVFYLLYLGKKENAGSSSTKQSALKIDDCLVSELNSISNAEYFENKTGSESLPAAPVVHKMITDGSYPSKRSRHEISSADQAMNRQLDSSRESPTNKDMLSTSISKDSHIRNLQKIIMRERENLSSDVVEFYDQLPCRICGSDDENVLKHRNLSNIDVLNMFYLHTTQTMDSNQYFRLLYQIAYVRNRVLLIPDSSELIKIVRDLYEEYDKKNKASKLQFESQSWDYESTYSAPTIALGHSNDKYPIIREILTHFCLWKAKPLLSERQWEAFDLKDVMCKLFKGKVEINDNFGLCVRLYAKYCNLLFQPSKAKLYLSLFYMPTKDRVTLKKKIIILPQDMSFLPPVNKGISEQVKYLQAAGAVSSSKLKCTLPEPIVDYKLTQTKNLKTEILSNLHDKNVRSLFDEYVLIHPEVSRDELSSNSKAKKTSSQDIVYKMYLKLKAENIPNEKIPVIISKVLSMLN